MIVRAAPSLAHEEAARRAASGTLPACVLSPGDADLGLRRAFVACAPVRVVRGNDVQALEHAWAQARAIWATDEPEVPVGLGYLSYDLGRHFERLRGTPPPPSDWPELEVRFYDAVWTVDASGHAWISAVDDRAADRLSAWLASPGAPAPGGPRLGALASVEPGPRHLAAVARVLDYLRAGDVYQVNLARRLEATLDDDGGPAGWSLFARLGVDAPAPHAFWMADEKGRCLVGNSPERLLRTDPGGRVETRPIKGTRARAGSGDAAALAAHPKDRAEHAMIVDLERNDLGRVCQTGTVEVLNPARIVTFPTVHHLVSTVTGRLRTDVKLSALLRAIFPGGSVTGAPKIRAMEIIDELESVRRGPYTGATGWLGAAGDLDLAVAIRTALVVEGRLTLWVGGGIVADSDPDEELRETEIKAQAFVQQTRA